jgi:hypothetical protein
MRLEWRDCRAVLGMRTAIELMPGTVAVLRFRDLHSAQSVASL